MLLASLLAERGEALEADFARYYPQHPLEGLWGGSLTVRKAAVLAEHLPPEAAVWRVGPDDQIWSREVQAVTDLRDDVRHLLSQKPPPPLPRPGDDYRPGGLIDATAKAERFRRIQAAKAAAGNN